MRPGWNIMALLTLWVGFSGVAAAGTGDVMDDLQRLREIIDAEHKDSIGESTDAAVGASPDLFPAPDELEKERAMRRTSVSLNVVIDGRPVILTDVRQDQWFAPFISEVISRGYMSGYRDANGNLLGLFGPSDPVTLEQLAKLGVKLAGANESLCAHGQPWNVSVQTRWSQLFVSCAEAKGWQAFRDSNADLTRPATRAQVVQTVLDAFGIKNAPWSGVFHDVPSNHPYAFGIERAAADGIVSGYADQTGTPTGFFGPDDPVSRAQAAKILLEAHKKYWNPDDSNL